MDGSEVRNAVVFRHVSKSYGDLRANDDVSFSVQAGSVHAVIGENGAGKSTLMRMLGGAETPDSGDILIDDKSARFGSPRDAARSGVGMVYQDLKVVPSLTVWENVVLGFEPRRFAVIDRQRARADVSVMIGHYRMNFAADALVEELPLSLRQQVEILRLLHRGSRILILDEPTAILTPSEVTHLFDAIRLLRGEGKTVLFVSHKLPEILEISDAITVMRGGRAIETVDARAVDQRSLVQLIVGRDLAPIERSARSEGDAVIVVDKLVVTDSRIRLRELSFAVPAGSILGVAGVAGNGQDELFAALSGTGTIASGRIVITGPAREFVLDSTAQAPARNVRSLRDIGVSYISQDRRDTGSAAREPLWFSMLAGRYWRWTTESGLLDVARARQAAAAAIATFAVKAESVGSLPTALSGGNLQKFIIGREMEPAPFLLIAEDPTRGVDIGSSRFIRQQIRRLADSGAAVILISTDLDELLEIADQVIVLSGGRLSGRFGRGDMEREQLGRAMTASGDEARAAGP